MTSVLHGQTNAVPNTQSVFLWSSLSDVPATTGTGTSVIRRAMPSIYSYNPRVPFANAAAANATDPISIVQGNNFAPKGLNAVTNSISVGISTALSIIPLTSPASGVIVKTDEATGLPRPVNGTLGPIFTERAETIGRRNFFIGFTHQTYHFTSLNGQSLNSLTVMDPGGQQSGLLDANGQAFITKPATFNIGADVRLSQNIAFLTYGVSNRVDVSVGLPMVHAAVAARTFGGQIFSGLGNGSSDASQCWCTNTFTPGAPTFTRDFGQASSSKSGFGDLLLRVKGTVIEKPNLVVAVGTDLRFPTGDETNYLGTGTTTVRPFVAVSTYTQPIARGIVFSPHFNFGWQFSGKSVLAGDLQATPQTTTLANGQSMQFLGAPFVQTKRRLPDVFTWAVGTEIAFGRKNTFNVDVLGNQIGWINGVPNTENTTLPGQFAAPNSTNLVTVRGLTGTGLTSFGQYSGAFGYKVRLVGNLVATFNALVRFDNNGLTARFAPLYGIGYSF